MTGTLVCFNTTFFTPACLVFPNVMSQYPHMNFLNVKQTLTKNNLLLAAQFRKLSLCTALLLAFNTFKIFDHFHFLFMLLSKWTLKFLHQLGGCFTFGMVHAVKFAVVIFTIFLSSQSYHPVSLLLYIPLTPTAFCSQSKDINPVSFIWVGNKWYPCEMQVDLRVLTNITECSTFITITLQQPNTLECRCLQNCLRLICLQDYPKRCKYSSVRVYCCFPTTWFNSRHFPKTPYNKIFSVV
jgi:hypothetical protein